ncbi:S24 family peptidase [Paralysiella testudinis]|uniref:Helix-turn-helix transcriptional regulator n=1 Tax=Paralysiella testudinis TaxID=2809020 RepID=A0A892ZIX3_9NEIS|nr:S24 family peptidase [Paralysiella testudinis]QRQ82882.1 helix-turn-helix transcriptional regulator [Paralysiella testudinis]
MNTLAERIRFRLKSLGKTQAGLGKYCKVRPPSITKWLNGSTKTLRGQNLLRAAEFLECDPDWLAEGKGFWSKGDGNAFVSEHAKSEYEIQAIDIKLLGDFIINTSDIDSSISHIEYTEEQYRRVFGAKEPSNIQITNMKGDNLSGTLEPGDLAFVDISIQKYDGDGIYLFVFGNHLHLKRLQMVGNNLLVISDNRQYKSWEITQKDRQNIFVIGKVLVGQSQIFQRF